MEKKKKKTKIEKFTSVIFYFDIGILCISASLLLLGFLLIPVKGDLLVIAALVLLILKVLSFPLGLILALSNLFSGIYLFFKKIKGSRKIWLLLWGIVYIYIYFFISFR